MPESGCPTKRALLKITNGSSGPPRKLFQKIGNDGGTASLAETLASGVALRATSSVPMQARAAASRIAKVATATTQRLGNSNGVTDDSRWLSGVASCVA